MYALKRTRMHPPTHTRLVLVHCSDDPITTQLTNILSFAGRLYTFMADFTFLLLVRVHNCLVPMPSCLGSRRSLIEFWAGPGRGSCRGAESDSGFGRTRWGLRLICVGTPPRALCPHVIDGVDTSTRTHTRCTRAYSQIMILAHGWTIVRRKLSAQARFKMVWCCCVVCLCACTGMFMDGAEGCIGRMHSRTHATPTPMFRSPFFCSKH